MLQLSLVTKKLYEARQHSKVHETCRNKRHRSLPPAVRERSRITFSLQQASHRSTVHRHFFVCASRGTCAISPHQEMACTRLFCACSRTCSLSFHMPSRLMLAFTTKGGFARARHTHEPLVLCAMVCRSIRSLQCCLLSLSFCVRHTRCTAGRPRWG